MADRLEAESKIRIVRAQIMAEETFQVSEIFNQQRILHLPQQQQEEEYDRVRLNLWHEKVSYNINSTNGLTPSLALAASMPPTPVCCETKIRTRVVWPRRGGQQDRGNYSAVAVGGWVCGDISNIARSKKVVCSKDDSTIDHSIKRPPPLSQLTTTRL